MPNSMLINKTSWGVNFIVGPEDVVYDVKKTMQEISENKAEAYIFAPGKVPLELLPEEVQHEAKETLKAFDEVSVAYEHEGFHVTTAVCLCANYAKDHFVCGRYLASEVYTTEERRKNSLEEFGYVIPGLRGKDYQTE